MSDSTHYRDSHLFDSVADSKDIVHHEERLEQIRSAVEISREAVKAVSITAIDLLKEIPAFIAGLNFEAELDNPFAHIEAPIWEEETVPVEITFSTLFKYPS